MCPEASMWPCRERSLLTQHVNSLTSRWAVFSDTGMRMPAGELEITNDEQRMQGDVDWN